MFGIGKYLEQWDSEIASKYTSSYYLLENLYWIWQLKTLPLEKRVEIWLKKESFTEKEIKIAKRIISCESGWNIKAKNTKKPDYSLGLWQLNLRVHKWITEQCAYDPYCSTQVSIKLYKKSKWISWSCYTRKIR